LSDPDRERNARRSPAAQRREWKRRANFSVGSVTMDRFFDGLWGWPFVCANNERQRCPMPVLHSESSGRFTEPRNETSSIFSGGSAKDSARWNTSIPRWLFFPSPTQDAPVLQVDR